MANQPNVTHLSSSMKQFVLGDEGNLETCKS